MEEFEYHHPRPLMLLLEIGEKRYYAHLQNGEAVKPFIAALSSMSPSFEMVDHDGFGKSAPFPMNASCKEKIHVYPGNLVWADGQLILCYGQAEVEAVKLADIGSFDPDELRAELGPNQIAVRLCIEWSE